VDATPTTAEQLVDRLFSTVVTIMKSSQTETMDVVAQFDLTLSQLRMLFVLDKADHELAMWEIAEHVSLSLPAAGRAIDTLLRAGLVLRREDTEDRRVKRVTLSPAGREATGRINESRHDAVRSYVDAMTADGQVKLLEALDGLPIATGACEPTSNAGTNAPAGATAPTGATTPAALTGSAPAEPTSPSSSQESAA